MSGKRAKRSEGLHRAGKAGEGSGKRAAGLLSPRPQARVRAGSKRKSAERNALYDVTRAWERQPSAAVESPLSGGDIPAPSAMVSRIARVSSGFVVSATFLGPDYRRHEVQASSATFAGVLAELAAAVASTLGAA